MTTFTFYDTFKGSMVNRTSDVAFGTDTINIALVSSGYTPASTDQFWSVPQSFEISGTGYSAGGLTTTATVSGTTTVSTKVTFTNVTWSQSASGFTNAMYVIIYKSTGTPSTSPLISYYYIGTAVGNVAGALTVTFDPTNGAFTLS